MLELLLKEKNREIMDLKRQIPQHKKYPSTWKTSLEENYPRERPNIFIPKDNYKPGNMSMLDNYSVKDKPTKRFFAYLNNSASPDINSMNGF